MRVLGVGDGGRGSPPPKKSGKNLFWQFLSKIREFFGQKSCKIRDFFIFQANVIKIRVF